MLVAFCTRPDTTAEAAESSVSSDTEESLPALELNPPQQLSRILGTLQSSSRKYHPLRLCFLSPQTIRCEDDTSGRAHTRCIRSVRSCPDKCLLRIDRTTHCLVGAQLPIGHGVQPVAFVMATLELNVPGGQGWVLPRLLAPRSSLYVPRGHGWNTKREAAPRRGC